MVLIDRENRIMNKKLRVITTGNFSLQKGAIDLVEVATRMRGRMDFFVRGSISQDAKKIYQQARSTIQFLPKIEQAKLPQDYFDADLFLFPTIQDGYAAVLAQASAAGLPILATTNCGARDFLTEGKDAWIFPIRRPDLMIQRLEWCDKNRKSLAGIAREAAVPKKGIEWKDRAKKLVEAYEEFLARQKG
jgi:glycosyltransferase involved in cell wall biosynthesis